MNMKININKKLTKEELLPYPNQSHAQMGTSYATKEPHRPPEKI
jgi:hypothetical protein